MIADSPCLSYSVTWNIVEIVSNPAEGALAMIPNGRSILGSCHVLSACVGLLSLVPALSSGQTVSAAKCHLTFTSPLFIPISGTLREAVVDPQCQHVFVTNATTNRVEVISLATGHLAAPIDVGSIPAGIDVTPDGSTLYVATSGANFISVVNIAQNAETGTISVPPANSSDDTPFSIAVANNGLAFLSTTFSGSGFGGRMLQVNLATGAVTQRTDFFIGGRTTESTYLRASSDKSAIGVIAGDISSGPVFAYSAATNKFTPEKDTDGFISQVATNGGVILASDIELALGTTLGQIGIFPDTNNELLLGVAFDPSGKVGYRTGAPVGSGGAKTVDVLDLQRVVISGSLPLGDTVGTNFPSVSGAGHMAISNDGNLLAVITDHGVSLIQPNPVKFVQFSKFDSSVVLNTSGLPGKSWLRAYGYFIPASSGGIDLANDDFALDIGNYVISIPAGSFRSDNGQYVYHVNRLTVTLRPGNGRSYGFEVAADGVTLDGSALPIQVTLAVGANQGSVTLDNTQAHFVTAGS